MKKILHLFLFLLLSVAASAGETLTFNDLLHWSGDDSTFGSGSNSKGTWDFMTDVKVTDNDDDTYTIEICNFRMFGKVDCGNAIFRNVPGTSKGNIVTLSTGGEKIDGEIVGGQYAGFETKMTVEGAFLRSGDQIYLHLEGKFEGWADDPFKIYFGVPIEGDPIIYKEPAEITYANLTTSHEADKIYLIEDINNEGTYKLIYKDFTFTSNNFSMGDYEVAEVKPTEGEDGYKHISYNGMAKLANLGTYAAQVGFYTGQEVPFKIDATFNDTRMQADVTLRVSATSEATVKYGVDPSEWVSTAINGVETDSNAKTEIFTIGGVKVNGLQKGLNIVRRGGKTIKVIK